MNNKRMGMPYMKRAITRGSTGTVLQSAMVPKNTPAHLRIGDRLTATAIWDMGPDAQIQCGEVGTVDYVNATTGNAEIVMEKRHKGLEGWDNHVLLVPYETDDIVTCASFHRDTAAGGVWRATPMAARAMGGTLAAALLLFIHGDAAAELLNYATAALDFID